jgi:hypothetical protein
MSWSASKMFAAALVDMLVDTAASYDLNADAFKVALYNDTITPSQIVTSANSCYGAGVWTSGSSPNVQDASGWPYAGRSLVTVTTTDYSAATFKFDAEDTVSANDTTTLASVYGCLVYDDTMTSPADQGLSYHYFGGAQSVTSGRFTVVWNSSGIVSIAL